HTSLNTPDGPIDVADPRGQKPFEAVTALDITTYLGMLPVNERTAVAPEAVFTFLKRPWFSAALMRVAALG
ncbi:MAG: hypothetical protein WAW78_01945, partial [Propioniciclava sp.]